MTLKFCDIYSKLSCSENMILKLGVICSSYNRTEWDEEDPSTFEAELAMLDEVEAEMGHDSQESLGELTLHLY